ncbi:MAG: DUF3185 family protein [Bdellovibrio sp.]|nr:DUF3185 family protein [Bdellovibrio sp.]
MILRFFQYPKHNIKKGRVESFSSDVSRFFTGAPTNKAVYLMIGGLLAGIVGPFGVIRGGKIN